MKTPSTPKLERWGWLLVACQCFLQRVSLPLWQQPHASGAEDVERRLLVFVLGDVSGGEAEEGLQVVTGLRRGLGQSGDACEDHEHIHVSMQRTTTCFTCVLLLFCFQINTSDTICPDHSALNYSFSSWINRWTDLLLQKQTDHSKQAGWERAHGDHN